MTYRPRPRVIPALLLALLPLWACSPDPEPGAPGATDASRDEAPAVAEVLRLWPDAAAVAVAMPPVDYLVDTSRAVAGHLLEDPAPYEDALAGLAAAVARPGADPAAEATGTAPASLPDALRARGIDPTRPAALFLAPGGTPGPYRAMGRAIATARELRNAPAAVGAESSAEPLDDSGPPPAKREPREDESDARTANGAGKAERVGEARGAFGAAMESAVAEADWVAVLPITGPGHAGSALAALQPPWTPAAHAVRDGWLVAGATETMVNAVLQRFDDPAEPLYGTAAVPAEGLNEAVQLVRVSDVLPAADAFLDGFAEVDPAAAALMRGRLAALRDLPPGQMPAPAAMVWRVTPEEVAWRLRLDLAPWQPEDGFPAVPEGAHAPLLPDDVTALVSFQLTRERRDALRDQWTEAMPDEMKQQQGFAQQMGMISLVTGMLGEEVTVAAATQTEAGAPRAFALVDLSDAASARALLQSMLGASVLVEHEGVPIMHSDQVRLEDRAALYYAIHNDRLLVGSEFESLKALVGRAARGEDGGLAASMAPPVAGTPYFLALARRPMVTGTLLPILAMTDVVTPGGGPAVMLTDLESRVRALRVESRRDGSWSETRAALYLD